LEDLPIRHRNHEIETLSERFLKNCIPASWVVNTFHIDYGTDYNCEIATDNKVTGVNFSIQLKGKETETNSETIKIKLKRTTISRWLNKLEPTLLVAYILDENEAYWFWFENNTVDLTLKNEKFTISIPRKNKLSNVNWESISQYVKEIFSKRNLLYAVPRIDKQNEIAWKAFYENKFEKALSVFYTLIEQKPKDSSVLEAIALSEYHLFNYQKALISINKALDIDNQMNFSLNKASILTEQGFINNDNLRINEAIKLYEKVLLSGHISYQLFYNYGSALTKVNNYEKSIVYFEKAIKLNPNKPEVWNNLGNAYMNIGQHDTEMVCYENALQINPDLAETLFSKGSSLFRYFGLIEEGLDLMLQATEKTDRHEIDNPYVFFWIAEAYISKSDFNKAIEWNSKGSSFFPMDDYLKKQKNRIEEI